MTTPTLADLRYAFYGGGAGDTVSDAEYAALLAMYDQGRTLSELAGSSDPGTDIGAETMPRGEVRADTLALTSQVLRLTHFTAPRSFTATRVIIISGATAAGATPTLVRVGVYEIASNGDYTLVASTPNDTALLAAANTEYSKNLSVAYSVLAGKRLAIGTLVVTAAAAPTVPGSTHLASMAGSMKNLPSISTQLTAQADLPSSIGLAAVTGNARQYARLMPA